MTSKQKWACKHGCPETKTPCKHLEKFLPNPMDGRVTEDFMTQNIDTLHRSSVISPPITNDIEKRLAEYGLPEHEIELILDRYVANLSLEEIAAQQGYVSKQQVWRLLNDITERLKKSKKFKAFLGGKE